MAEDKKIEKQVPNNVVALGPTKCCGEGCNKKPDRAGFCAEHFDWFKAGLLTKEGMKAADFEKKHYHYMRSRTAA